MTVSFESTSTATTLSLDETTTTSAANDFSANDVFTPSTDDSSAEVEPSATFATTTSATSASVETGTGSTKDNFEFDLGDRQRELLDDGRIEMEEESMRMMRSLEMEEVSLHLIIRIPC